MKKGMIVALTATVTLIALLFGLRSWKQLENFSAAAQEESHEAEKEIEQEMVTEAESTAETVDEADMPSEVENTEVTTDVQEETVSNDTSEPAIDDAEQVHTHDYAANKVDATCTNKGYTVYFCACGAEYTEYDSPKKGHNYMMEYVPSDVDGEDMFIYTCTTCGYSYQEVPGESGELPDVSVDPEPPEKPEADSDKNPGVGTPETEDYGFCPYCGRRIWTSWYPEGCFTFLVDSICDCGVLVKAGECHYHKAELTEPESCSHEWKTKYYPQEGHYGEYYNVCKCGWRFDDPKEWETHVMDAGGDAVYYHTSWASTQDYIIDAPERYEWICTKCGEVSETEP